MKQSGKRIFSMIFSLALVAAAIITYLNFGQPAYIEVKDLRNQVASETKFVASQREALDGIQKLIRNFNEMSKDQEQISKSLPIGADTYGIITNISSLAEMNSLSLQSLGFSEPKILNKNNGIGQPIANASGTQKNILKQLNSISVNIKLIGTYENLKGFIRNLEKNILIFDVRNVSISPSSGSNNAKQSLQIYSFDITAETYYQSA
ncbi:MAG: hypothetical protein WCX12_00145 [Candidatus Paceibacterota bacterium]|jgi:Tfp pilus assembly protein PilO